MSGTSSPDTDSDANSEDFNLQQKLIQQSKNLLNTRKKHIPKPKMKVITKKSNTDSDSSDDESFTNEIKQNLNKAPSKNVNDAMLKAKQQYEEQLRKMLGNNFSDSDSSSEDEKPPKKLPVKSNPNIETNGEKIKKTVKSATSITPSFLQAATLSAKKGFLQKIITDSNDVAKNIIKQKEISETPKTPKSILKTSIKAENSDDQEMLPPNQTKFKKINKDASLMDASFANALSSTQIPKQQSSDSDSPITPKTPKNRISQIQRPISDDSDSDNETSVIAKGKSKPNNNTSTPRVSASEFFKNDKADTKSESESFDSDNDMNKKPIIKKKEDSDSDDEENVINKLNAMSSRQVKTKDSSDDDSESENETNLTQKSPQNIKKSQSSAEDSESEDEKTVTPKSASKNKIEIKKNFPKKAESDSSDEFEMKQSAVQEQLQRRLTSKKSSDESNSDESETQPKKPIPPKNKTKILKKEFPKKVESSSEVVKQVIKQNAVKAQLQRNLISKSNSSESSDSENEKKPNIQKQDLSQVKIQNVIGNYNKSKISSDESNSNESETEQPKKPISTKPEPKNKTKILKKEFPKKNESNSEVVKQVIKHNAVNAQLQRNLIIKSNSSESSDSENEKKSTIEKQDLSQVKIQNVIGNYNKPQKSSDESNSDESENEQFEKLITPKKDESSSEDSENDKSNSQVVKQIIKQAQLQRNLNSITNSSESSDSEDEKKPIIQKQTDLSKDESNSDENEQPKKSITPKPKPKKALKKQPPQESLLNKLSDESSSDEAEKEPPKKQLTPKPAPKSKSQIKKPKPTKKNDSIDEQPKLKPNLKKAKAKISSSSNSEEEESPNLSTHLKKIQTSKKSVASQDSSDEDDHNDEIPSLTSKPNKRNKGISSSESSGEEKVTKYHITNNSPEKSKNVSITVPANSSSGLKGFEASNPHLNALDKRTTLVLDNIDDDEEIWLMQCPKTLIPKNLIGQQLDFTKKSKIKIDGIKYEYTTQKNNNNNNICVVASENKKNNPNLIAKLFNPAGNIIVHQMLKSNTAQFTTPEKTKVKLPENLKVRHPIFGKNFKEKIELSESITNKLLEAEITRRNAEMKAEKKKKRKSLEMKKNKEEKLKEDMIDKNQMIFQLLNQTNAQLDNSSKKNKKQKLSEVENNNSEFEINKKIKEENPTEVDEKLVDEAMAKLNLSLQKKPQPAGITPLEAIFNNSADKKKGKKKGSSLLDTSEKLNKSLSISQSETNESLDTLNNSKKKKKKENPLVDPVQNNLNIPIEKTKIKKDKTLKDTITSLLNNVKQSLDSENVEQKKKKKKNKNKSNPDMSNNLNSSQEKIIEIKKESKKHKKKENQSIINTPINKTEPDTDPQVKKKHKKKKLEVTSDTNQVTPKEAKKSKKEKLDSLEIFNKDSYLNEYLESIKSRNSESKKRKRSNSQSETNPKKKSKKIST